MNERLTETFDKHLIPAYIEQVVNSRSQSTSAKAIRSLAAELVEAKRALEWIEDFASKMTDRHTGFVHIERRARAALVSGDGNA